MISRKSQLDLGTENGWLSGGKDEASFIDQLFLEHLRDKKQDSSIFQNSPKFIRVETCIDWIGI